MSIFCYSYNYGGGEPKFLNDGGYYLKNERNVFFDSDYNGYKKVWGVNYETFISIGHGFAHDKNNCYYWGKIVGMSECEKIENQK